MGKGNLPKISELQSQESAQGFGPNLMPGPFYHTVSPGLHLWEPPLGPPLRGFFQNTLHVSFTTLTRKCLLLACSPPRMDIPDLASSWLNPWQSQFQAGPL